MRKIIALLLVLFPGSAWADSGCQVVDYQDHYELVCTGAADQAPAPPQRAGREATVAAATPDPNAWVPEQLQDVPPEKIGLNGLSRSFAAIWARTPVH